MMRRGELHITVPVHGGQILRIGTLRGILRDVKLSPAQFTAMWE